MTYETITHGDCPDWESLVAGSTAGAPVLIHLGDCRGQVIREDPARRATLIELGTECLGDYTGEAAGDEGSTLLGFARYRNGADAPSDLVELVRQPNTPDSALAAAKAVLEAAGLQVAVCADRAGRIIDRLVRPKYNAALTFLDEGLATAADMDLTCKLGLGYPDGPIERLERGGLAAHYQVSHALFQAYGTPAYAPARRAAVAYRRSKSR
ncbi:MAG: 3-hydroxyacyl-CoA dehydrogenase family protein [Pseudomonadota bacterium]